jgi:uncharacterized membrane protein YciS (DUF1049 family)
MGNPMRIIINFLLVLILAVLIIVGFFSHSILTENYIIAFSAFLAVLVAYWQLDKIHIGNSLQLIIHLEEEWNSEKFRGNRKKLAQELKPFLSNHKSVKHLGNKDWEDLQSIVEDVIDFYEKLGSLVKCGRFPMETVYDMYSYYAIGCWECLKVIGYVERIKAEHENAKDFYEKFYWIYCRFITIEKLKNYFICHRKWTIDNCKDFCEEESTIKIKKEKNENS